MSQQTEQMGFVWGGSQWQSVGLGKGRKGWILAGHVPCLLIQFISQDLISVICTVAMWLAAHFSFPLLSYPECLLFFSNSPDLHSVVPSLVSLQGQEGKIWKSACLPQGDSKCKDMKLKKYCIFFFFLMHQYAQLIFRKVESRCVWKYRWVGFVWDQAVHLIWFQLLITFSFFNLRLWTL